jgi:hypothetical protein
MFSIGGKQMAKENRAEEAIANLDWDSPPNNRFKAWPIELKSPRNSDQGAHKQQSSSDDAQQKQQDR